MPTILDRVAKTWGDAARDVVLIVVSILIAFALDAWWQDRAERRVESEQIAALRSEFETARDTLKSMSEYLRGTTQATNELLVMMGPDATVPDSEKLFALLERSLNFGGAIPNQTALTSVLAAGISRIEERDSLVGLLGRWPALMEDLEADFAHLERNRDVDLQSALIDIGIAGIGATPSVRNLGLPPPSFPADLARLVRSVKVYAALSYRALRLSVLSLSHDEAIERADSIIAELDRISD